MRYKKFERKQERESPQQRDHANFYGDFVLAWGMAINMSLDYTYENRAYEAGFRHICGIDEAGRGPLAGPVCAAAVILPLGLEIEGLDDSKKLSASKREELSKIIRENAIAFHIEMVPPEIIDRVNILNATFMAMNLALEGLNPAADYALVDGNIYPRGMQTVGEYIIGGDGKSPSVAAASILAKTERDKFMTELSREMPGYFFEKHKGYGTKAHIEAIHTHGVCKAHRMSFLRNII